MQYTTKYQSPVGELLLVCDENDAKYFYSLWIPLLDFVNQKNHLIPSLYDMKSPHGLPLKDIASIAKVLWQNPSIIENYMESKSALLNEEDRNQLTKWMNNYVHDKFIVDRHLQKGSVLISLQNENVYVVKGIYSSWREMLHGLPMPHVVEATLIPFKDTIIHDGIVIPSGVTLGKNMADNSKQLYLDAKSNNTLHFSL